MIRPAFVSAHINISGQEAYGLLFVLLPPAWASFYSHLQLKEVKTRWWCLKCCRGPGFWLSGNVNTIG